MADRKVKYEIDVESRSDTTKTAAKRTTELGHEAKKTGNVLSLIGKQALLSAEGFHVMGLAAHEAHAKVGEFLEFVGAEAAVDMLKEIAEKVIDIGKEAVVSAAKAERMNRVIDSASGGHEKGKENREWLERFASGGGGAGYAGTEFSEEQVEGAYVDLKKVGETDQRARLAIKAAADIAAVSKNKDEAFGTAVEAFAHLKSMGTISARQLMPLGLGVEDFKKLDRYKGKSDKSIRTAMEGGKIGESDLYQLIMSRAGETKIGARAADNADLLSTKMAKLAELPERFYKRLGETGAVTKLSNALDGILKKFDPDSPTGAKIFDAMEGLFSKFSDAIASINLDDLADSIKDDVIPAIEGLVDLIKPMVELMERMFRGAHRLHDMVVGPSALHNDTTPLAKQEEEFRAQVYENQINKAGTKTVVGSQTGNVVKVHHDRMHFEKSAEDAFASGEAIADGLAAGVDENADAATKAAGAVADHMVETVKRKHKTHSPSEVFADIGEMDIAGYVQAIRASKDDISDAMGAFAPPRGEDRAAPGGGGFGAASITIGPITIQVMGGQDGAAQGAMAADAFSQRFKAEMGRWLDEMRVGAGA